jgi:transposase
VEALAVEGEGLGRSRGGLTSKIHLAVDGKGRPMSILVTPGQAGDNPQLLALLDQVSVRPVASGSPRRRPRRVIADKAYSHPSTRQALRTRGIVFTCPERSDQIAYRKAKGPAGGRPPGFDSEIYKRRNVVERCFNKLKQFRGLATRFAKRVAYYRAEVVIATIAIWLRDLQDTP